MPRPDERPMRGLSRRELLIGSSFCIVAVACGGNSSSSDGAADNQSPVWAAILDQSWVVGVPVSFDLLDYCSDADADALSFSIAGALPPGLTLVGSVITGTPTAVTPPVSVTVTADDGRS